MSQGPGTRVGGPLGLDVVDVLDEPHATTVATTAPASLRMGER